MEQQKCLSFESPISERALSHPLSNSPQSSPRPRKRLCPTAGKKSTVHGHSTNSDCESLVSKAAPNAGEYTLVPFSLSKPTVIFDADPNNVINFPSRLWRRSTPFKNASDSSPPLDISAVLYETSPSSSVVRETGSEHGPRTQGPYLRSSGVPPSAAVKSINDEISEFLAKELSPNDIPSPPSTSSSDKQPCKYNMSPSECKPTDEITEALRSTENGPDHEAKKGRILKEESNAPSCSENSEFFSFSCQPSPTIPLLLQVETSEPLQNSPGSADASEPVEVLSSQQPQPRYYTKAFNFVLQHVIKRYGHILKSVDVDLVRLMQSALSENGIALFVRLYRRKQPHWYRVEALRESYAHELDVETGLRELCSNAMLISSECAAKAASPVVLLLARELLQSLDLTEMRDVCGSVVEGNKLKNRPKTELLPALRDILTETIMAKRRKTAVKKRKQMTLTGKSPSECLANAILKRTGHCIRVPTNILTSLARIHFLFFFESGHDSPNVILADTGKVIFPNYVCEPSKLIFPSARAYEDYEQALSLERDLNDALENRNFESAAYYGSIAELEVREFFGWSRDLENSFDKQSQQGPKSRFKRRAASSVEGCGWLSKRPQFQKVVDKMEAEIQLKHPFFKRFTALWVYVRASWHSVHALERLGEYEGAISRLKLLLRTELMARRRGKCLNRLTINMFKHVQKYEEALQIIKNALGDSAPRLHYGDRMQLANRGVAIHRKIHLPDVETRTKRWYKSATAWKKAAVSEVTASRPQIFTKVLQENETQIAVRKIFGKSLKIQSRDRRKSIDAIEDPWQRFLAENSRDSVGEASLGDRNIMGKAVFRSFRSDGSEVSVEDYCLEWYFCKEGWTGNHTEGGAIRFIFCLMMWESVIFKEIPDVFQTPYQDRPLDLMTEAFFESRKDAIEARLNEINIMSRDELREDVSSTYEKYEGTRALGCIWNVYSKEDISCIACGLGTQVISRCCKLLCDDYGYWSGGLPDLTLWKVATDGDQTTYNCKLVEVKSARDHLSEKQRAWLIELSSNDADCEVCKVVEKVTTKNSIHLEAAKLSYEAIKALSDTTMQED